MIEYPEDWDAESAGVKEFQQFGQMMIVHSLSGGDPTKYESIMQSPWSYVFLARRINLQQYLFEKSYSEIKSSKK